MNIDFDAALATEVAQALEAAHGPRRTRRLTVDEVRACAQEAARSTLGLAWKHAGETGDPRAQTTLCLCVRRRDGVAIGVASVRAQEPDPSRAWRNIAAWSRSDDVQNASRAMAWAASAKLLAPEKRMPPTSEGALREAIRANPDDDAPRLVYADLLSERGDPRGEFIALQCAGQDASALLELHGAEWAKGLEVEFVRGFASRVRLISGWQLEALMTFAPEEFVTELVVEGVVNERLLAASPWLRWVRHLEFRSRFGPFDVRHVEELMHSPHLGTLESLAFVHQHVADAGLLHLCAHATAKLPRVRRFTLEADAITTTGVLTLAATRWFSQLEELSLSGNPLGPGGVAALTRLPRPSRLKTLRLDHVRCGDEGVRAVLESNVFPSLERLSMDRNRLSAKAQAWLRDSGFERK